MAILETIIACCSVMWSTNLGKSKKYSFRSIILEEVIMTLIGIIKGILVGTGGCGICAGMMFRSYNMTSIVWIPKVRIPQSY